MHGTKVEVTSRRFVVPLDCPCCGATPDAEITVGIARAARDRASSDSARSVDFPYCRHCVEHVERWESGGVVSAGLIVLGLVAGAAVAALASPVIGVTAALAGIVFAAVLATSRRSQAKRGMRESCSSPGRALEYLGWNGIASGFRFESISYAARFAEQNAGQLVEDPAIRKLLERYKLARIAVPTPAAAVAIPPPLDVGDWIARIAKTSGRVARRGELSRALEAFREPREREQVIRAVSAIELAALLAPLEQLASASDKQRHLRTAIEQVRYDNIPDELQQEMLRDLEGRLSRL
ncbi:MAG TPA: hypothetical protein VMJ10_20490 [Kofleriaceae bacterium]|nr:hypothetical protein [Kofleriaceae bacterium]